jgi:transposase
VVSFVKKGGGMVEAAQRYEVDRKTVYNWVHCEDLQAKPHGRRRRKLDKAALVAHVKANPDALLRERAEHFGVHVNAVWVAMRAMDLRKKNDTLR